MANKNDRLWSSSVVFFVVFVTLLLVGASGGGDDNVVDGVVVVEKKVLVAVVIVTARSKSIDVGDGVKLSAFSHMILITGLFACLFVCLFVCLFACYRWMDGSIDRTILSTNTHCYKHTDSPKRIPRRSKASKLARQARQARGGTAADSTRLVRSRLCWY